MIAHNAGIHYQDITNTRIRIKSKDKNKKDSKTIYLSFFVLFFSTLATVGGYCSLPGECICSTGYQGANCEIGKGFVVLRNSHVCHS